MISTFYNFSGGMESAAMLAVDWNRIQETKAIACWANTGKQFPEMTESIAQISKILDLCIVEVPRRITFDEFLFERGGMLRKGMTDCSRRMKRANLKRFMENYPPPYEVNLGFNSAEIDRAEDFIARNESARWHWRFPLIEANVSRERTWQICEEWGFTILLEMYRKMGRFDCFWCPNQSDIQAALVARHYPERAQEWIAAERLKGHSFKTLPAEYYFEAGQRGVTAEAVRSEKEDGQRQLFACGCFGGSESVWE